jgi:cytochrome c
MKRCTWVIGVLALGAASDVRAQAPDAGLRAHGGPVRALAVMPDGRLASAGFDSAIIIWDLNRGQAVHVLRQHATAVNALIARRDGCLVSGGEDAAIKIWCEGTAAAAQLDGHTAAVSALAVTPDGRMIASGSWDRSVRIWDLAGQGRLLVEHPSPVTAVAFTADGTALITASQDGTLRQNPIGSSDQPRTLKLPVAVNGIAITRDGRALLACADGIVRTIDQNFETVRDLAKLDGPLTAVTLSPDRTTLAVTGFAHPLTLIDLATGAQKLAPNTPGLPAWAVAFSADGREVYTGSGDRAVRRFDATTGSAMTPPIPTTANPELSATKDRGARVFRACIACHGVTATDTHLAGPTLHQIMGRRIASATGYEYSSALRGMDIVWTPETIAKLFELGPTIVTPGTKMPEQRITDPEDRQALVDWLARVTVP